MTSICQFNCSLNGATSHSTETYYECDPASQIYAHFTDYLIDFRISLFFIYTIPCVALSFSPQPPVHHVRDLASLFSRWHCFLQTGPTRCTASPRARSTYVVTPGFPFHAVSHSFVIVCCLLLILFVSSRCVLLCIGMYTSNSSLRLRISFASYRYCSRFIPDSATWIGIVVSDYHVWFRVHPRPVGGNPTPSKLAHGEWRNTRPIVGLRSCPVPERRPSRESCTALGVHIDLNVSPRRSTALVHSGKLFHVRPLP